MAFPPRVKGRKLHLVIWYSNDDTAIQARLFEDRVEAGKFYDALNKRSMVHTGLREIEVE